MSPYPKLQQIAGFRPKPEGEPVSTWIGDALRRSQTWLQATHDAMKRHEAIFRRNPNGGRGKKDGKLDPADHIQTIAQTIVEPQIGHRDVHPEPTHTFARKRPSAELHLPRRRTVALFVNLRQDRTGAVQVSPAFGEGLGSPRVSKRRLKRLDPGAAAVVTGAQRSKIRIG